MAMLRKLRYYQFSRQSFSRLLLFLFCSVGGGTDKEMDLTHAWFFFFVRCLLYVKGHIIAYAGTNLRTAECRGWKYRCGLPRFVLDHTAVCYYPLKLHFDDVISLSPSVWGISDFMMRDYMVQ